MVTRESMDAADACDRGIRARGAGVRPITKSYFVVRIKGY